MPDSLFGYRLAAKLGRSNVAELVNSLTDEEWQGWQAVAIIDGWYNGWGQTAELIAQMNNQTNRLELLQVADPKSHSRRQEWQSGAKIAQQLTNYKRRKTKKMDFKALAKQLESREHQKR